jgi:uncharacterized protein YcfL
VAAIGWPTMMISPRVWAVVLALLLLSGCSCPPDEVVMQGVEQDVKTQVIRDKPRFFAVGGSKIKSCRITNSYQQGEARVYEYEADVHAVVAALGALGMRHESTTTIKGKVLFQRQGNGWQIDGVE